MPFTQDSELELLFDGTLLPQSSVSALADKNLHLRPLAKTDYARGHLDVLADLTSTPDVGATAWSDRFALMRSLSKTYYIIVAVDRDTDRIVATGSLVLEHKFLRAAGTIGHIEDIAVSKQAQGKRLGYHVVTALTELSTTLGCYKSILDCSEDNRGFYEKCGHEYKGIQMANYADKGAKKVE